MKKSSGIITKLLAVIGVLAIIAVIGGLFLINHDKKSTTVTFEGSSMTPTIQPGKEVTVNAYHSGQTPQRGDIIEFTRPSQSTNALIKRVVALPGEHITIANGKVTVTNATTPDGFNPDIGYLSSSVTTPGNIDLTVSTGDYYVMGDNRAVSLDSRSFGPIPASTILGKVTQ